MGGEGAPPTTAGFTGYGSEYGIHQRKLSLPNNKDDKEMLGRFSSSRRDGYQQSDPYNNAAESGLVPFGVPRVPGARFLHSVHANRRPLNPILQSRGG